MHSKQSRSPALISMLTNHWGREEIHTFQEDSNTVNEMCAVRYDPAIFLYPQMTITFFKQKFYIDRNSSCFDESISLCSKQQNNASKKKSVHLVLCKENTGNYNQDSGYS